MRHRPRDETKSIALEAAARLIDQRIASGENLGAGLVGSVRMVDVAADLGITTGSLYPLWADQDAFQRDVLKYILRSVVDTDQWSDLAGKGLARAPDAGTALRGLTEMMVEAGTTASLISFAAIPLANDPEIGAVLRATRQEAAEIQTMFVEMFLSYYGLRMRPPLKPIDLARVVNTLIEGQQARRFLFGDKDWREFHFDENPDIEYSFDALIGEAVGRAMTEPDPDIEADRANGEDTSPHPTD